MDGRVGAVLVNVARALAVAVAQDAEPAVQAVREALETLCVTLRELAALTVW